MKYNTLRRPLIFPEYGRGIHEMLAHALTIKDRAERNLAVDTIIKAMQQINPNIKQCENYMQKLYDQLHIMADFKLDIDCPYPIPDRLPMSKRPRRLSLKKSNINFRYYGKIIEKLIDKVAQMPEGDEKNENLNLIVTHMRKLYFIWNDEVLRDDMLAQHLDILSGGRIVYSDNIQGKVTSSFYNKPTPERRSKFINLSPYENYPDKSKNRQGANTQANQAKNQRNNRLQKNNFKK